METMRLSLRHSALLLIVLTLVFIPLGKAFTAESESFVTWASSMSNELDSQWDKMSQSYDSAPVNFSASSTSFTQTGSQRGKARRHRAGRASWSYINPGYTQRGARKFLPLTSRPRGSATRGTATFNHPARGNHGLSYDRRRPASSFALRRRSVSSRGVVSRPRLARSGRITTGRRRSGTAARTIRRR